MDSREGVPSRFVQAVRDLGETYYTRREVAEMLHVTPQGLLGMAKREPAAAPYGHVVIGRRKVHIYREQDVLAIREFLEKRYPVRANGVRKQRTKAPIWTREERLDRNRRFRRVQYLKTRADLAGERGEERRQLDLLAQAEQLRQQMKAEYDQRREERREPRQRPVDWLAS